MAFHIGVKVGTSEFKINRTSLRLPIALAVTSVDLEEPTGSNSVIKSKGKGFIFIFQISSYGKKWCKDKRINFVDEDSFWDQSNVNLLLKIIL